MKPEITNKFGLPDTVVRLFTHPSYSRGASDFTVTQLIGPAFPAYLATMVEARFDVAQKIFIALGIGFHLLQEQAAKQMQEEGAEILFEERLYTDVLGRVLGGQFDQIQDGVLRDFKVTSVWSYIYGKKEHEQQLNLLRLICHDHADRTGDERYRVEKLEIVWIFRDYSEAKNVSAEYPSAPMITTRLPVWSLEETRRFAEERAALHLANPPAPCSDEERWASDPVFALMKPGRVSAVRLYKTSEEAIAASKPGMYIEHRPRQYRRCESFCDVAHGCPILKSEVPF